MRNTVLQNAATNILNNPVAVYFRIDITFTSTATGSAWSLVPYVIDDLTYTYDYISQCYDSIVVDATVSPKDYALMQDQGQSLQATVILTYVTENNTRLSNPLPVKKKYRVLLMDAYDIRKSVPDVQLYTTPTHKFSFRLIEDTVYQLRHTKLSFALQTGTMHSAIHALAHGYDISTMSLIDPDNTHTYDHIILPSYIGFSGSFGYLQSHFGVYMKGMTYYLTNSCLYIYPPYETNPTSDRTITFFQVRTGQYGGLSCKHCKVGNDYQVIIDSQPHSQDLSIAGVENHGTGVSFINANTLTDGYTSIDANKGAAFNDDIGSVVSLTSARTMDASVNNIKHITATENPYPHMSLIAMHQASLMQVSWPGADPFAVIPNTKVVYCYDRNGTMLKKTGIVEHAEFKLSKMNTTGTMTMFGCNAQLTLRLAINDTQTISSTAT